MIESCFSLPCFDQKKSNTDDDGDQEDQLDPVLLVSGIGGTILNSRDKRTGFQIRVWVRILLANFEFTKRALSLYNPKTGYAEPLDVNTEIVVPDDDYGLYAIDILDPSVWMKCLRATDVYHFHDMIDMLVSCGYKKGTTLFGYGYDFRQSNRIDKVMDGLKEKLAAAYKASGGRKVNIVSHSMGGLIVSCFLSLHHEVFAKYVSKWICIACPFQGAPGCINDALLTGLEFVDGFESYLFVSRWTMHQLLVECPSIYEMLPNPEFKWKQQPQIKVWRKQPEGDGDSVKLECYDSTESISLFEEALKDNEIKFKGKVVGLPFNLSILQWADETRDVLNKARLPDDISFYNIFGTSFDTPFDVSYGSEASPIEHLSEVCHSVPQYSFVDGDGTVPSESTMADGFAAKARVGVAANHRALLQNKEVFKLIQQWLGVEVRKTRRKSKSSKVRDEISK